MRDGSPRGRGAELWHSAIRVIAIPQMLSSYREPPPALSLISVQSCPAFHPGVAAAVAAAAAAAGAGFDAGPRRGQMAEIHGRPLIAPCPTQVSSASATNLAAQKAAGMSPY